MCEGSDQPALRAFPWLPWVFNPRRPGTATSRIEAHRRLNPARIITTHDDVSPGSSTGGRSYAYA